MPSIPLEWGRVTINGSAAANPAFYTSREKPSYVFRAERAGSYRVEVWRPGGNLPFRVWSITVVE